MEDLRNEQVEEAKRRLAILQDKGLHENVMAEFCNDSTVYYSESMRMGHLVAGILYWVQNEQCYVDTIKRFEEETGGLVYHATHEHTNFGEIFDLFYVSKYPEEWEGDRMELEAGCPFVKAVNLSDEILSDFGCIHYKVSGGGLVRTA